MNELHAKAIQATARFIERKGYKVLATQRESPEGATADLVADDDGIICCGWMVAPQFEGLGNRLRGSIGT